MPPRLIAVLLFFAGLTALEISAGFERWSAEQDRYRTERLDLVDHQQEALAREVAALLGAGNRHTLHLSKNPVVAELLAASDDVELRAANERLARLLLPYIVSFPELDGVSVVDGDFAELFRCERMGGGVASLPLALLASAPGASVAELFPLAPGQEVAVSPLVHDPGRVEVAENERWVFHLVARVDPGGEARRGAVAVTIYAAPLLHALSEFKPLAETTSCLLDDDGAIFAAEPAGERPGGVAERLRADPALLRELSTLNGRIESNGSAYFVRPTGVQPASRLVSALPETGLVSEDLASTALWTALRSLVVIALIGFGSAFFVRTSLRAERLRETESYLERIGEEARKNRALMEAAADLILIVDVQSERVDDWNPRARAMLGAGLGSAETPQLAALVDRMTTTDAERLRASLATAAAGPGRPVSVGGLRIALEDGATAEVDARCVGLESERHPQVEIALTDRTRERELERRAHTAERLSSLGLVAAGVAHEINNPLEGIANYLVLLERTGDPELRKEYLGEVRRGFQRIRDITGELLPIAREERGKERADLRRVVERVVSMARLTKDFEQLEVQVDLPSRPLVVRGSEGRVEQVVLNLLINAGRVMDAGGRLSVALSELDERHAEVRVEDEGPGIAAEDLDHLFDPFFSKTGGTGLGLSVSYGIAKALGGELLAENRSAGGACFRLRLVRAERDIEGGMDDEA